MLKFEWPLILPDDPAVRKLADASFDITEYVVDIAKNEGLSDGLEPLDGGVAVHFACHARAQNMGAKAAEMMRLIPNADVSVIERCSGHGGSWGIKKENFETAIKVGRPAARQSLQSGKKHIVSECPLAGMHQPGDRSAHRRRHAGLRNRPTRLSYSPAPRRRCLTAQVRNSRRAYRTELTRDDIMPMSEYVNSQGSPARDRRPQTKPPNGDRSRCHLSFREFRQHVATGP